jgi:NADPH:quinone reductase
MSRAVFATAYGGPEALALRDVDVPSPGRGEVSVEVRAAGVNRWDVKVYSGLMGHDPSRLPIRLGSEVAGVVTAVGEGATGPAGPVAVGDEVIGYPVDGAYAEALTAPAGSVLPKPVGMGWAEAAGLCLAGVAAHHLNEATRVAAGETVLVHGASGGVGRMAAQLALVRGARVVGTAGAGRHDELRAEGVLPVAYGDVLEQRVREVAPDGVDAALDTVGSDEAVDVSIALVGDRRRIATIAAFDRAPGEGILLLGNGPGADPGTEVRTAGRLVLTDLVRQGRLRVVVARTFTLEEVAQAHAFVAASHAGGKVALLP